MKREIVPALLLAGLILLLSAHGWAQAQDAAQPPKAGEQALVMAQQLYCQIKDSFSSKLGLMIGLLIAMVGLWRLIQGNINSAAIMILAGALVSAVPSMLESVLGGIGAALGGLATQSTVNAPKCGSLNTSVLNGLSTDRTGN